MKKGNKTVLLERFSLVESNYLKFLALEDIRGHYRSLEVTKGQMEVKIKMGKKSTIWTLLEKSSIVEFNYLIIVVTRGH